MTHNVFDKCLNEYVNIPEKCYEKYILTGSSVICNPPVLDTDIDFVIKSKDVDIIKNYLTCELKFNVLTGEESETNYEGLNVGSEYFYSLKKDNINIMLVQDESFFIKWLNATLLAKKLNLLKKEDRITLFQYVLYDNIL
jgi:hypothetical protein